MTTPLHRRPGVTVAELQAKRKRLLEELHSPEHIAKVVTRDYGDHDPRIAPFPPCTCGAQPRLDKLDSGRWVVRCTDQVCGKKIREPQVHDWSACLDWCQLNMSALNFQELPLFGLAGLDTQEAKARLTSIYNDLLLKTQIATLDVSLCQRTHQHVPPGRDYIEKMQAYRDWAKLCLRLLKSQAQTTQEEKPQC